MTFEDLNVDPILAVEILGLLDMTTDELSIGSTYTKFKEVVKFAQGLDNPGYYIKNVTRGKFEDKLKIVSEYFDLMKNKSESEAYLNKTKEILESIADEDQQVQLKFAMSLAEEKLGKINDEISIYED